MLYHIEITMRTAGLPRSASTFPGTTSPALQGGPNCAALPCGDGIARARQPFVPGAVTTSAATRQARHFAVAQSPYKAISVRREHPRRPAGPLARHQHQVVRQTPRFINIDGSPTPNRPAQQPWRAASPLPPRLRVTRIAGARGSSIQQRLRDPPPAPARHHRRCRPPES